MVGVEAAAIEGSWPADPSPVFFSDAVRGHLHRQPARNSSARPAPRFPAGRVRSHSAGTRCGARARYLPGRGLHLTQALPVIGLTGELLLDTAPAQALALWQGAVAAALCLAFGALLWLASERRRGLAVRLAAEERANALLEARVAERTRGAVARPTTALRREIGEREAAEARLRRAQADLIQAGKLSALGQMSAGISHELNQPLMAIRSFAENAGAFLDARAARARRARTWPRSAIWRGGWGGSSRTCAPSPGRDRRRSGRRSDRGGQAVLELTELRMRQAGVALDWAPPGPVWVRGGEVRLQQVVMNLVSNAVEAMEGAPSRGLRHRDPRRRRRCG